MQHKNNTTARAIGKLVCSTPLRNSNRKCTVSKKTTRRADCI